MMNAILPILIVSALGVAATVICYCNGFRYWRAVLLGAIAATVLWTGCAYVLLWLTAPNELGPLLVGPIGKAFATAFAAGTLAIWIRKKAGLRVKLKKQ